MSKYLYETHMHTVEVSACATATGVEQARIYKKLGYEGIIVTDHFYNGNTSVPRNLPWEDWVERFVSGYENAKREGDRIGLSVFFGWEESFEGNDFLVFGLDKDWLLEHPEILSWSIEEHYKYIKADGGLFIHAHPFREADYIKKIRLFPEDCDGVEIINSSHRNVKYDKRANSYALNNNKPITAGSDSHHVDDVRGGMLFDHKLEDIHDFIASIKAKKAVKVVRDCRDLSYNYKKASYGRGK